MVAALFEEELKGTFYGPQLPSTVAKTQLLLCVEQFPALTLVWCACSLKGPLRH